MATTTTTPTPLLSQARNTLTQLQSLQTAQPLSILRLSEPITSTSNPVSNVPTPDPNTHPSALLADLSHYRDLFTKLHFSYIEQVTKEKYLRAIVGDPPVLHTHAENVELETEVLEMKQQLKQKKVQSEEMVEGLRREAEALVARWEEIARGTERAASLERMVGEGEERVGELRNEVREMEDEIFLQEQQQQGDYGDQAQHSEHLMKMGLQDTLAMIEKREVDMRELEGRIQGLEKQVPLKTRECEIVERDLENLEMRKNVATAEAREARRRKEQGEDGGRDEVEERGRWFRSQELVFKGLGLVEG